VLTFLKLLKGYLLVQVTGYSPERFMNLCSNKNILLWNIIKQDGGYLMCISLKAFRSIRPIVKKTGTKVVILKRYGLPFFIWNIKKRSFFLIGLLLAFFFWYLSANFIWEIEVNGNHQISDDEIFKYLEEKDVKVGKLKNSVDIENMEKGIRQNFDIITWTSAKLTGTKLNISIKENDVPIMDNQTTTPEYGHLLADYDGIVKSMIVRSGEICVEIGQEVKKGDILVNGCVPVYAEDGTVKNYHCYLADADIYIEHSGSYKKELPIQYVEKQYSGRMKKNRYIELFGKEISLFTNPDFLSFDILTQLKQLVLLENLYLPIYTGEITYREFYNVEKAYSDAEAKLILTEEAEEFWQSLIEKGVQIVKKNVTIEKNDTNYILNADYTVIERTSTIQKFEQMEIPITDE